MTKDQAYMKAQEKSMKRTAYVVYDGEEFGGHSCGGYQVCREEDLEGFYQGCPIIAAFEAGEID